MSQEDKPSIQARQKLNAYMVFFSNEWAMPPAFYWIDEVQGISPQDAYKRNLERIIQAARDYEPDIFGDMSVDDIEEGLCVVPPRQLDVTLPF